MKKSLVNSTQFELGTIMWLDEKIISSIKYKKESKITAEIQ